MDFDPTSQLLITYYATKITEKKLEYNEAVRQLFVDFKKA